MQASSRLQVPTPSDFESVLADVLRYWQANQADRYAAGALTAGQWIAGTTDDHPLTDEHEPCTAEGLASCQMAADAVVYGWAWAPAGIDRSWALGVAGMVSWARGASKRPPIAPAA